MNVRRLPFLLATACCVSVATTAIAAPATDPVAPAPAPAAVAGTTPTPFSDAVLTLLQERGLAPLAPPGRDDNGLLRRFRDGASDLVLAAVDFIGVPYRRGGASAAEGFDCSGFTRHVFEHSIGLVLPRRADEQARQAGLSQVLRQDLKPGDLVFFNTMRRAFSHVGIYVGEGRFVHAPRSGAEVRIEDMRQSYWAQRYDGARRASVFDAPPPARP